jgi:aconitate hydratase
MGVLPLQFREGTTRQTLRLDGSETIAIGGLGDGLKPRSELPVTITRADGRSETIQARCRIDTEDELEYFRHGGILHYVLRTVAAA